MENIIIAAVILVIVCVGILRIKKHFGGGGCCSSGSQTIRDRKTLSAPKCGEIVLHISGMHCENCEIRVENALNRLENVACHVSWRKKKAVVEFCGPVSEAQLRETVEKLGYSVTAVE